MADSFVHFHCHTDNSMLDGLARIDDMVRKAALDGQPALAITDHGNVYGLIDHYLACKEAGVVPILGCELYSDAQSRFNRRTRKKQSDQTLDGLDMAATGRSKDRYHTVTLAINNTGYKNLIALSSEAYLSGYYGKPRIDWELLEKYHDGLVVTTSCLGGMVPQALMAGEYDEAVAIADRMQQIMGKENMYVELQDHGIPEQLRIMPDLIRLSQQIGAPLLATNDSHFVEPNEAAGHDALLCVQTSALVADTKRFRFSGEGHWLRTAAEMRHLFRDVPIACDNTLALAERVNIDIEHGLELLPPYPVPAPFDTASNPSREYLRHLVNEGADQRYGSNRAQSIQERIDFELNIIETMGFNAYFLVVWDLMCYAQRMKYRVGPGRGSAAGSVVAYCLQICHLDPLRWDLLFERFLNPGRQQMPDIDLDFDDDARPDMLRYTAQRYGVDRVAQVVTFSSIKSRSAVRDAARVMGMPYSLGDTIAKAMPPLQMGRDTPIAACLEMRPGHEKGYEQATGLRDLIEINQEAREVVEVAQQLEGLKRSDGIHASAVVIADRPLIELVPVQHKPKVSQDPADVPIVTQYDMHALEWLGLLKIDFLGLRNLSVIERTIRMIEDGGHPTIDMATLPLDDQAAYEVIRAGHTAGIFQLESSDITRVARNLAPTKFEDIGALLALYRPGPMAANMHNEYADRKNNTRPAKPLHKALVGILDDTYQLMIYQEQLMKVAQIMAGFTLIEADDLRRACGKKKPILIAQQRSKFVDGCKNQGYDAKTATDIFNVIEPFANYGFNKCVTSDTLVDVPSQDGTSRQSITIGDLSKQRKSQAHIYKHQQIPPTTPTHAYSLGIDDQIHPTPIKDIHYNGQQPVWTVHLSNGQHITATANHRHLTPTGWRQVDQLHPGDQLLTVADAKCDIDGAETQPIGIVTKGVTGTVWVDIAGIEYAGIQDTYDLEMDDPGHNWVGNGIVTHNSHAYCYGHITYQTAWLKAHWPAQYLASLLSSVTDDVEKLEYYMGECRRMKLAVTVPDINKARTGFWTSTDSKTGDYEITFGLEAIKGIGPSVSNHIIETRQDGPFTTFWDFIERTDPSIITDAVVQKLAPAGCFDSLGHHRKAITLAAPKIVQERGHTKKRQKDGSAMLFDVPLGRHRIDGPEWPVRTKQNRERDVLSSYVSSHPLDDIHHVLDRICPISINEVCADPSKWADATANHPMHLGGIATGLVEKTTKKGARMGVFTLLGIAASIEVVVFPKHWHMLRPEIVPGEVLAITGRVVDKDEQAQFIAESVKRVAAGTGPTLRIDMPMMPSEELKTAIKDILGAHRGWSPVCLVYPDGQTTYLPPRWDCDPVLELIGSLRSILSPAPALLVPPSE